MQISCPIFKYFRSKIYITDHHNQGNEKNTYTNIDNVCKIMLLHIQVDVDVQKELAEQYGLVGKWSDRVSQVPTFVFIRNGRTIIRFTGTDPNKVENTIKAMLNPSSNIIVPIYDFLNPIN